MKNNILKKILPLVILLTSIAFTNGCTSLEKMTEKDLNKKIDKYEKRGFDAVGALTIRDYFNQAREKELVKTQENERKYMVVYTKAVGPTYQNAKEAALAGVRSEIAGQIETRVFGLVSRSLVNNQISQKSADAINKTVTAEKQFVSQAIIYRTIYEIHREIKDERDGSTLVEMELAAFYDPINAQKEAKEKLKQIIRDKMEDEAEELHKALDDILGL